ncbi:MAG: hypothetical protein R3C11_18330 [Planctomycetaceae bacterium]
MQLKRLILTIGIVLGVPLLAWACKYSVRDVGFVSLEPQNYKLRLILPAEMKSDQQEHYQKQLSPLLRDTNIELEVLGADSESLSPAQSEKEVSSNMAAAWLIDSSNSTGSDDLNQEQRELFLKQVAIDQSEEITPFLWEVANSDLRGQLIGETLKNHSVLLIVQGSNQEHNQQATELAEAARKEVQADLPDLPKPVEFPSKVITLPQADREQERILLWSLNLDPEKTDSTYVIPLFGRGRLLGEPLAVPGTSLTELNTILSYVGQDCECELDRSWMQGKMIPHRWDQHMESVAAKTLDFDPGSPLVKSEITRILARGPNGRRNLQVGLETEGDLISLEQPKTEEVSAEDADDILRELNVLPESEEKSEEAKKKLTSSAETVELQVIEGELPGAAPGPNAGTSATKESNGDNDSLLSGDAGFSLEIGGGIALLLVILLMLRSRRG